MWVKKDIKGITLVELIIAMTIASIAVAALYSIFSYGLRNFHSQSTSADNQANVRMALNFIGREIRKADKVEINNNVIKVTHKNGDIVRYKQVGSDIRRGDNPLIDSIESFTATLEGNHIVLTVESKADMYGHSITLSSEIFIRE